jgi:hypothetical protein
MNNRGDLAHNVTFCVGADYENKGARGEIATVNFLLENLDTSLVGNYHMLVNYNIPALGADLREVDILLINRFGIFLLEVKDWQGDIEAHDDGWYVKRQNQGNVLVTLKRKGSIIHSQFFGGGGALRNFERVSTSGLVVLVRGVDRFWNKSNNDTRAIFDLSTQRIISALSSTQLLFYGPGSRRLSDQEIAHIRTVLYREYKPAKTMVGPYELLKEIAFGDPFTAYEARDTNIPGRRVRVKRYEMPTVQPERMVELENHFKRNIRAVSPLHSHGNILHSNQFFQGPEGPYVFYEVTELTDGSRLDEIMARTRRPLTLPEQLHYLEPLSSALQAAHTYTTPEGQANPIFHRNVNPEVVYITREGVVKLGDFDFAKLQGKTIFAPGNKGARLNDTVFIAPELRRSPSDAKATSDIYSLGVLWFFLASLPTQDPTFRPERPEQAIDQLALPEQASTLMKRMMAYAPGNRPQSMTEVINEMKTLRGNAQ